MTAFSIVMLGKLVDVAAAVFFAVVVALHLHAVTLFLFLNHQDCTFWSFMFYYWNTHMRWYRHLFTSSGWYLLGVGHFRHFVWEKGHPQAK